MRYLTGFTGTAGGALLRADGSGLFLTDFRYQEQSAAQVGAPWEIAVVDDLPRALAETLGAAGRLGVDETSLTLRAARKLRESLGDAWELAGGENEVAKLREVKEAGEVDALRAAARLADEALAEVVAGGLAGRSELEVAFELELAMRRLGAQALSFPPIVASGPRGALPHAQPTGERIEPDVLVTIDWGAELDGYCSDCTRTFATGEGLPDWAREIYERHAARTGDRSGRDCHRDDGPRGRRGGERRSSSRPATGSGSATASATASGSRSMRARRCHGAGARSRWPPVTS